MSDECLFCKIASRELDTDLVYEDEEAVAFKDITPQAPIHILVIPKKHFNSIKEAGEADLTGHLFNVCNKIANEKRLDDFRLVVNTGPEAGQSVFHFHIHLLAGRKMNWPPG